MAGEMFLAVFLFGFLNVDLAAMVEKFFYDVRLVSTVAAVLRR